MKSLIIIDLSISSIDPIHNLKELLSMQISTYCKSPINFDSFPNLIDCGFEWIKGSDSLFERSSIKKLFINSYDKKNSNVFSKLFRLEALSIMNSKIEDIRGLASLKNLKSLRLANLKNIKSLQGLEHLHQLEDLEIQRCKGIGQITEVFSLGKLKELLLLDLGDIASIKGLEDLTELAILLFYESTNIIDGDLFPVLKLKKLSKIAYQNRTHYTHRREDFGKLYRQEK